VRPNAWSAFGAPAALTAVNSAVGDYGPSVSFDGLTLYLSSARTGGAGSLDLWVAARPNTASSFAAPVNLSGLNSASIEDDPSISSDGLSLYFSSDCPGTQGRDIFVATRPAISSPFGAPAPVAEINSSNDDYHPGISADSLTLFFASTRPGGKGGVDIWMATRPSKSSAFGAPTNVSAVNSAANDYGPSPSADGLTLYFNADAPGTLGGHDIWYATRVCL
jgi:Tol biopolymer transport system component